MFQSTRKKENDIAANPIIKNIESSNDRSHDQEQTHPPKYEAMESPNVIGDLMWPIILFLKIFGQCPLTYEEVKPKSGAKTDLDSDRTLKSSGNKKPKVETTHHHAYKIQYRSFFFLWSVLSALWILFGWINFVQDIMARSVGIGGLMGPVKVVEGTREKDNKNKLGCEASSESFVVNAILSGQFIYSIIQGFDILLAWAESDSLAQFLNRWNVLQAEILSIFPKASLWGQGRRNLKTKRNIIVLICAALPSIVYVPSYIFAAGAGGLKLVFFMALPCAWHASGLSLMEEIKVVMVYLALANVFRQIREGMVYSIKTEKLTPSKINCWRRLIHSVGFQVDQAARSQKNHQLFLIASTTIMITVYLLLQIGRMKLKIWAANTITRERGLIASELVNLKNFDDDLSTKYEIKFLYDMITQNPCVISFGNYINLNNRLLLGMGSQIVTYLIVLMQFAN